MNKRPLEYEELVELLRASWEKKPLEFYLDEVVDSGYYCLRDVYGHLNVSSVFLSQSYCKLLVEKAEEGEK